MSALNAQLARLKAARARMGMVAPARPVVVRRAPVWDRPLAGPNEPPIHEVCGETFQNISVHGIIAAVARDYEISTIDILSERRQHSLIEPRHVAMYLAVKATTFSLPAIGRVFRRDHTTVLHAQRKIAARVDNDAVLSDRVARLLERSCWKTAVAPYWGC